MRRIGFGLLLTAVALGVGPTRTDAVRRLPAPAGGGEAPPGAGPAVTRYLGGSGLDEAYVLAVHPGNGRVYVAGRTTSTDLVPPAAAGAFDAYLGGARDAFVGRLSADLESLERVTYLGGAGDDQALALAFDDAGRVFVAGETTSDDLPALAGAAQPTRAGGDEAFVARLDAELSAVEAATYEGTADQDAATALAVHGDALYVAVAANRGSLFGEVVVSRYALDLDARTATATISAPGSDAPVALAVHRTSGDVYVAGRTSYDPRYGLEVGAFPGVDGGAQADFGGMEDAFVARLSQDLAEHRQSTYLGGGYTDGAHALAFDGDGALLVTGYTSDDPADSDDGWLPAGVDAFQDALAGQRDAFVVRLSEDLTALEGGTYLGGAREDRPYAIAVDGDAVLIAGLTDSDDLPGVEGGVQPARAGSQDAFAARLRADLGALEQATYLGGTGHDDGWFGLAVDGAAGFVWVVGGAESDDLPGALNASAGSLDAFVGRLPSDLRGLASPDLTLAKTGPSAVDPGAPVTYTLTVENVGDATASRVVLADALPSEAAFVEASPSDLCRLRPEPIVDQAFDPSTLDPEDVRTAAVVARATDKAQTLTVGVAGEVARVDVWVERPGTPPTDTPLQLDLRGTVAGVPLEDDAAALVALDVPARTVGTDRGDVLDVDLTVDHVAVAPGDALAIVLRCDGEGSPYFWNGGGRDDPYGPGTHYVRTPSYPAWTAIEDTQVTTPDLGFRLWVYPDDAPGTRVVCELGALAPGSSRTVTITVDAPNADTTLHNGAQVGGWPRDANLGNDVASLDTRVGDAPPLDGGPAVDGGAGDGGAGGGGDGGGCGCPECRAAPGPMPALAGYLALALALALRVRSASRRRERRSGRLSASGASGGGGGSGRGPACPRSPSGRGSG